MELYVNPQITGFRQDVDGTIKELKIGSNKEDAWENIAEQGSSAKLDNNKTATINVSTYTEPVEVLPTSGKDGMKKATITLSNIPSPGGNGTILYAWSVGEDTVYLNISTAPLNSENIKFLEPNSDRTRIDVSAWENHGGGTYEKISDVEFTSDNEGYVETFTRDTENDLVI